MKPQIDHISISVRDLQRAEAFYDQFLPLVGFDVTCKTYDELPAKEYKVVEYYSPNLTFVLVAPRGKFADKVLDRRMPGMVHHLAFRLEDQAEVSAAHAQCRALGFDIVDSPQLFSQYAADYFAFFLNDSEVMRLEVVNYRRG